MSNKDAPAKMGKKDLKEEKASPERENKIISVLSPRGERFKEKFLSKIVPWEKLTASLDDFPQYIDEHTKTLLMECVASHLKQKNLRKYRGCIASSSEKILLHSIPGTELYRERLVSTIARELQVPLMKLDGSVLPPYDEDFTTDFGADWSDDDDYVDVEFSAYESDDKVDNKGCKLEKGSDDDDYDYDEFSADESNDKVDTKGCKLKKGDRVIYVGKTIYIKELNNRKLATSQRGEVYEVDGEKIAVVFNICGLKTKHAEKDEKNTGQALVTWLDAKYVKQDINVPTHDCYIAVEVLYEVLASQQPVIAYFPDSFLRPSMSYYNHPSSQPPMPYLMHNQFPSEVKSIFNQLPEGVVMICAENTWGAGYIEIEKQFPEALKEHMRRSQIPHQVSQMRNLFTNVIYINPPKDQDLLNTFIKQIEEDRLMVVSEGNLSIMHKVLKEHNLVCKNLEHALVGDITLTMQNVEKIVGWATNHYLSSCPLPSVNKEQLHIPYESIKLAILRFKENEDTQSKKESNNIKDHDMYWYEKSLAPAVVRSEDIGVKFDDVGALENVKRVLYETVILPIRRPELFSHGNLLRPCKGILLFGPPGTGKTLIAKALATESGANFINITAATFKSMWRGPRGETENPTKPFFSYASKLAPVIIFVDEVDRLLGARGHCRHETSEFMAAWDGLNSKESEKIIVIGATNRPFDLDEAVIHRMPRRIYVGLPDAESRSKILKVLLHKENLESEFSYEQLAEATEGYSGSDLKNLCVAAAYKPIEELLEQESKADASDGVPAPALRPLKLNDFIHSKTKVRPSVSRGAWSFNELRAWNERYG